MNRLLRAVMGGFCLCPIAFATVTWDFTSPLSPVQGQTYTGSGGGATIRAYGFYNSAGPSINPSTGAARTMQVKAVGTCNECGLGFLNETNIEIDTLGYIELDLHNIALNSSLSLLITSVQATETYNVYNSSTGTGAFSLAASATNLTGDANSESTFTFTRDAGHSFIAIEASRADVLLNSMTLNSGQNPVPEPRFYALLLVGILGVVAAALRKRQLSE